MISGTAIICDDAFTYALIDCPYTYWLKGIDRGDDPQVAGQIVQLTDLRIYGGHEHDLLTHPYYWVLPPRNVITVDGGIVTGQTSQAPFKVQGKTEGTVAYIKFNAPETAGTVWQEIDIGSDPGWVCVGACYTETDSLEHDTIVVGYGAFLQLDPAGGLDYFVKRNRTPGYATDVNHPDSEATWGEPYAVNEVLNIAHVYHDLTGYRISINDMSLPEGGVFDIYADRGGTWTIPHRDHRMGSAFDVNPRDESGDVRPCGTNMFLKKAIRETNRDLSGNSSLTTPVKLVCEPWTDPDTDVTYPKYRIHVNALDPVAFNPFQ